MKTYFYSCFLLFAIFNEILSRQEVSSLYLDGTENLTDMFAEQDSFAMTDATSATDAERVGIRGHARAASRRYGNIRKMGKKIL